MDADLEHSKTAFDAPTVPMLIVIACLMLSFIDMLLLSTAIEKLLDTDQMNASLLAFFVALVGNATAFLWGRSQGLKKDQKKFSFFEPWIWMMFGFVFVAIRVIVIFMEIQQFPEDALSIISSESLMAFLLLVLYIGTGLTLQHESRKIFDPDNYKEWRRLRAAKKIQNHVANKYAEVERLIIELENFDKYYRSLNKQYVIQRNALYDAERATLSSVVKQVLEDNPRLDPQVVEDILQTVLADRPHVSKESPVINTPASTRSTPTNAHTTSKTSSLSNRKRKIDI